MRLVRLADPPAAISRDIRAALLGLGTGADKLGGVALLGHQPEDAATPIEALIILPTGILAVVGIDLPEPGLKVTAPLDGQWLVDGWPLVSEDGPANPATDAMRRAEEALDQIAALTDLPRGIILAIGPYAEKVEQPDEDRRRGVRILHPTAISLTAAAGELTPRGGARSVEEIQKLIDTISPQWPKVSTADMVGEGFTDAVTGEVASASTVHLKRSELAVRPGAQPVAVVKPVPNKEKTGRHNLPSTFSVTRQGAIVLTVLLVLVITLLILALTVGLSQRDNNPGPLGAPDTTTTQETTDPPESTVDGITYERMALVKDDDCVGHAYGDLQQWLGSHQCTALNRALFRATQAAISVSVITMPDAAAAEALQKVADQNGTGSVNDLAKDGKAWPGGPTTFDNAAYASSRDRDSVRIVRAVWLGKPSSATDPKLRDQATRALKLSLS
ncbi:hypothetical protein D5S17_07965 [Pseudonocardiaceae bacterium YIM PH 21723]|nr:hypothetical protein D5S17_07965 [Pseudonocardiaceae bacterium YIM PH 21723]